MKKLYQGQRISIYKTQKDLGLGHYTLYNYANGNRDVKDMSIDLLKSLSTYFDMKVDDLYEAMLKYQSKGAK